VTTKGFLLENLRL